LRQRLAPCLRMWSIQQYAIHVEDPARKAHTVAPVSLANSRDVAPAHYTLHGVCQEDLAKTNARID
jgi:hypothetical protein